MTYRWNVSAFAEGYDAAAGVIHPHYDEVQDQILKLLPPQVDQGLIVELGGGSGRLAEKLLLRFPHTRVVLIDQSQPFLAIAERRMARFGERGRCVQARLQDDWESSLDEPAAAIVSTSAIHHLEPQEKRSLYQRCYDGLAPGGVLLNGDEVRPADDTSYLALLQQWASHMRRLIQERKVPESMDEVLQGWIDRNVARFDQPRKSGDDCHETIAAQLDYFRQCGFASADAPWQRDLWAILRAAN
jgi:SAM-dependent methyltransferase